MSSDGHEPRTREATAYDLVKDDVLRIFATLRVRLTHFDGSGPGDKCWGFFLGVDRRPEASDDGAETCDLRLALTDGVPRVTRLADPL
jgi:hypothetical protein